MLPSQRDGIAGPHFSDYCTLNADFLTLWKDADPNVPILKQAKAEYAKLK
jgi:hypothetical protein